MALLFDERGEDPVRPNPPPGPDDVDHPMSKADPNFVYNEASLPLEYWTDWLIQLAVDNTNRIASVDENAWDFLSFEATQYLFTVCIRLRLPNDVRFSAALILDRFMLLQTRSLWNFVATSESSDKRKEREWEKIETNLSRQLPLRILSAIQIASKEHSYHTSLSTKQVCSCLRTLGFAYTAQAVRKSELRVLKVLDFALPKSPLIYPESLIKCLDSRRTKELAILDLDLESIWQHVLLLLDLVLLHHAQFYDFLLSSVMHKDQLTKFDVTRVKMDWMMLGSGLIVAAVSCVRGPVVADTVTSILTRTAGTPEADIRDTSIALLDMTLSLQKENEEKEKLEKPTHE